MPNMSKSNIISAGACILCLAFGFFAGHKLAFRDATDEAYKKVKEMETKVEIAEVKLKAAESSNERLRGYLEKLK